MVHSKSSIRLKAWRTRASLKAARRLFMNKPWVWVGILCGICALITSPRRTAGKL
ncbi:hypothetical protein D3C77_806780 [compost metagenome]